MQGVNAMKGANVMNVQRCEKGAGLILAMVLMAVLAAFAAAIIREGTTRMRTVEVAAQGSQNRLLAEAALGVARADLDAGGSGVIGTAEWVDQPDENGYFNGLADWCEVEDLAEPFDFGHHQGHYWTQVVGLGNAQYKKIIAYGRVEPGPTVARCEMVVRGTLPRQVFPAFSGDYAIYAGKCDLRFAGTGEARRGFFCEVCGAGPFGWWGRWRHRRVCPNATFRYDQATGKGDYIDGDIYVEGNVQGTGNSRATGKVTATGEVLGTMQKSEGGYEEFAKPIDPPDFFNPLGDGRTYREICDIDVGKALKSGTTIQVPKSDISGLEKSMVKDEGITTVPAGNPAHIFAYESYKESAYGPLADATEADNYQLGDWVSVKKSGWFGGYDGEDMVVQANGNSKSYYIPGNLWIDPLNYGGTFFYGDGDGSETEGVQITIVVEGNVYIGDHIKYGDDSALDCVAFIAIQARDEFGNPVDRQEGSGNIYFGDLNASADGLDVNAMLFAENRFDDIVKTSSSKALTFTLRGLMAAAGSTGLQDRGSGVNHVPMTVRQDRRLVPDANGNRAVNLPALPLGAQTVVEGDPVAPWTTVVRWSAR